MQQSSPPILFRRPPQHPLSTASPPSVGSAPERRTPPPPHMTDPNLSSFLWSVADLLRGDYKQSEHGKVILPFTVLRRLDCVLAQTKAAVQAELATRSKAKINPEPCLLRKSWQFFYNTSPLDLKKLVGDQDHIGVVEMIRGLSQ
jgi:hypothetical protein